MSLFDKFKIGLEKSSSGLTNGFKNIFSKKNIDENVLTEFEELIITSDAGVDVAKELRKDFENFKIDKKLDDHKKILKLMSSSNFKKRYNLFNNVMTSSLVIGGAVACAGIGASTSYMFKTNAIKIQEQQLLKIEKIENDLKGCIQQK